jgi:hypothetical protein
MWLISRPWLVLLLVGVFCVGLTGVIVYAAKDIEANGPYIGAAEQRCIDFCAPQKHFYSPGGDGLIHEKTADFCTCRDEPTVVWPEAGE